jgi:hypothetical protein
MQKPANYSKERELFSIGFGLQGAAKSTNNTSEIS